MNNQQRLNVSGQTRDHGIIGLKRSTHWLALADHHGVNINKQLIIIVYMHDCEFLLSLLVSPI